ncbi:uncharacterized protein CLUP02_15924 [Colletotrichum lupini]|uniref:Uncharacterized protein n=1 Tax=Colletotrichum lupini TaxID=145971 RepID=A0A9Q8T6Z8_9PEZI|nr:uncharacterized protein CLUP02_15924 [Colletotrichum lupini]UQC90394.1 hypothetical protein CLUP02_15924 [Colletotrichum lupini]
MNAISITLSLQLIQAWEGASFIRAIVHGNFSDYPRQSGTWREVTDCFTYIDMGYPTCLELLLRSLQASERCLNKHEQKTLLAHNVGFGIYAGLSVGLVVETGSSRCFLLEKQAFETRVSCCAFSRKPGGQLHIRTDKFVLMEENKLSRSLSGLNDVFLIINSPCLRDREIHPVRWRVMFARSPSSVASHHKTGQSRHERDLQAEEEAFFLDDDNMQLPAKKCKTSFETFSFPFFWISCVLLGLSTWFHLNPAEPSDLQCVRKLHVLSPVQDILEYEDVQFDNAFWKTSPYKGRPTPELEAKWKDLWYYGSFDLSDEYLPALNKTSHGTSGDSWARTKPGYLLAGLEVFHNLHCLNLVRQFVHRSEFDYSDDPAFHGGEDLVLAVSAPQVQNFALSDLTGLICWFASEVDFFYSMLIIVSRHYVYDCSARLMCPKYDRIVEWAKQRQIMVDTPK